MSEPVPEWLKEMMVRSFAPPPIEEPMDHVDGAGRRGVRVVRAISHGPLMHCYGEITASHVDDDGRAVVTDYHLTHMVECPTPAECRCPE